ncbi:hypothetical protein X798_04109 [Onchocerca flexuosa]|uniref:Uncharacterized protein n=1 Tax=Onchocerca flexuosa TaxID=387005 RepID=A0A238BU66_9BILA|nr:hypothetical protein X798_04109 [Onchocerca flexuosa]
MFTYTLIIQEASEKVEIVKLCPSDGESFITAWQLICVIKKKPSPPSRGKQKQKREDTHQPLSMIEMMHYCCNTGANFRIYCHTVIH